MGLRPEHIRPAEAPGGFPGAFTLIHVEQLGGQTIAYGRLQDKTLMTVALDGQRAMRADDVLHLTADPKDCHLFDENGKRI